MSIHAMSQHQPPPIQDANAAVYQPVSGFAVAAVAVGGLFALVVAITTIVGIVQGAPVFFPMWSMAIPIAGVALALYAQRHIQNSEGTRVGVKLARIGLWASLVSGLSYFSYFFVTGLALQNQANTFLMEKSEDAGFFPRLREGTAMIVRSDVQPDGKIKPGLNPDPVELNRAFLLTQAVNARTGRPDDDRGIVRNFDAPAKEGMPGPLSQFREGVLGRIFYKSLGADAEVTPLAVQAWGFEKQSYRVARGYRVKTKEIEYDLLVVVNSQEPDGAGMGRKWFVNMRDFDILKKRLTPLGEGMKHLRGDARTWLEKKLAALSDGEAWPAIKDLDQTPWQSVLNDDDRVKVPPVLYRLFTVDGKPRLYQPHIYTRPEDPGMWEQTSEGTVRVHMFFRMMLPDTPGDPPAMTADATVVLESKRAINPEQFAPESAAPGWSIVRIRFSQVGPLRKNS